MRIELMLVCHVGFGGFASLHPSSYKKKLLQQKRWKLEKSGHDVKQIFHFNIKEL